jgi:hypothetical protein
MNCIEIAELAPLYLSGELDSELKASVAAHCRSCARCSEELAWRARLDLELRGAFPVDEIDTNRMDRRIREAIAVDPIPSLRLVPQRRRGSRRWLIAAMGTAAVLLLAGLGYRHLLGSRVPRVFADAALDHQKEVVDQRPRHWITSPQEIDALARKQGVPESAVAALASGTYHLKAAKLCYLDYHVFLHLVFQNGTQQFSIFLRQGYDQSVAGTPREQASGRQLYTGGPANEGTAAFRTDRFTVVIVADPSADAAVRIARFAAAKL